MDIRYPIGQFTWTGLNTPEQRAAAIDDIAAVPQKMRSAVLLLRSLSDADVKRRFTHPELGIVTVDQYISLYAWHGKHHVAHITSLRERNGW